MKLRNVNPMGESEILSLGLVLDAGQEFDVPDELGLTLLEQAGNFVLVGSKKDLDGFTVAQLTQVAAGRGAPVEESGKKADVVAAVAAVVTDPTPSSAPDATSSTDSQEG